MTGAPHTARAHSKLSPSSAKRWLACPGSIRMQEPFPDTSSVFADEGTSAHMLAERCLRAGFDTDRFRGDFINIDEELVVAQITPIRASAGRSFEVTDEMVDAVQVYVDECRRIAALDQEIEWDIEQRLDLTHIPGMEGGTGDFLAYWPSKRIVFTRDLKYGSGVVVEALGNEQQAIYGLGVAQRYHNRGVDSFDLGIVQPRAPHPAGPVRNWVVSAGELIDFEIDLTDGAAKVAKAEEAFHQALPMPWHTLFLKAGDHCKFCRAEAICPARQQQAQADVGAVFAEVDDAPLDDPRTFDAERLARILRAAPRVRSFFDAAESLAHAEATHGRLPPGFKLVAKRSTRKWRSESEAVAVLTSEFGLHVEEIYAPAELKSPAQVEPRLPGKNKAARADVLRDLVVQESSGTVLALESDPRPAVRVSGEDVFGEVS